MKRYKTIGKQHLLQQHVAACSILIDHDQDKQSFSEEPP
jgi:hypothetical protein